ncbi:MAG TPA: hypothetical protein DCZ97_11890 [Syntrophus sp. (in: bacteria)]|nr:hypothetical protein [Syntrophus sp. (in: bacteria)]
MKPQDAGSAVEGACSRRQLVFVLLWALILMLLIGCAPKRMTTGAFKQLTRIDEQFKRGVSTKEDVKRILGSPRGGGSAILPPDRRLREVWFYEDIEVLNVTSPKPGIMRMDVRQQILLVFFEEGVFDGYMWFSNAVKTKAEEM